MTIITADNLEELWEQLSYYFGCNFFTDEDENCEDELDEWDAENWDN